MAFSCGKVPAESCCAGSEQEFFPQSRIVRFKRKPKAIRPHQKPLFVEQARFKVDYEQLSKFSARDWQFPDKTVTIFS